MPKPPKYTPAIQDILNILLPEVKAWMPDERPTLSQPLIAEPLFKCVVVVRAGRNIVEWLIPMDSIHLPEVVFSSLEAAIAKRGLAGVLKTVYKANVDALVTPPEPISAKEAGDSILDMPEFRQLAPGELDQLLETPPEPSLTLEQIKAMTPGEIARMVDEEIKAEALTDDMGNTLGGAPAPAVSANEVRNAKRRAAAAERKGKESLEHAAKQKERRMRQP